MKYVPEYYHLLYSPEAVDVSAQDVLLSDLSQLSRDHSLERKRDISYDEISRAVTQLNIRIRPRRLICRIL